MDNKSEGFSPNLGHQTDFKDSQLSGVTCLTSLASFLVPFNLYHFKITDSRRGLGEENEETLQKLFYTMTPLGKGPGVPTLIKSQVTCQLCGNEIKGPEG